MMADPRGTLTLKAGGNPYRFHMGTSVLADLQSKYGQDVLGQLDPPKDAAPGWMPDLNIVRDIVLFSLQRYHADEADRYLVDDIMAENPDAFGRIMGVSFPDADPSKKRKAPRARR